jgi:bifunctional non-homologous end joining protein LigD
VIFDLDPGEEVDWPRVIEGAIVVREFLAMLGLKSFVKTSGGKGLHVIAPLARRSDWEEVKSFARAVAERIARTDPRRYIAEMNKARRRGKIYIDYLRNGRGATSIAPYSTRARSGAPVSTPLFWDELSPAIGPDHFTVENLPARLDNLRIDPWEGFFGTRQSITAGMMRKLGIG